MRMQSSDPGNPRIVLRKALICADNPSFAQDDPRMAPLIATWYACRTLVPWKSRACSI